MSGGPEPKAWQISYIRRAVKLRKALTLHSIAAKLGVSVSTVSRYGHKRSR